MNILITMFRIFYAGAMTVYPSVGMYGNTIIQSAQALHRLGKHFGWFQTKGLVNPGPQNEAGSYIWWQDGMLILKNLAPLGQKLLQGLAK